MSGQLAPLVPIQRADEIRIQCVFLVLFATVSFRSIPRILSVLQPELWVPHFTSVINWSLRFGLALLQSAGAVEAPWVAIIDASIDVSVQKVLVILRVPLSALAARGSAITLKDAECIGISIADNWNGELVCAFLKDVFAKTGTPVAIIQDGGSDLNKGVKLLNKSWETSIPVIEDVGHFAANALKAAYSTLMIFQKFLVLICKAAAKLRQSDLAFLTPPKLRSKGRFQNISKLAAWAALVLPLLGDPGRVESTSLAAKLRAFIPRLARYRAFLTAFSSTCLIVSEFLALMKNKGLNQETYELAKTQLNKLPQDIATAKLDIQFDFVVP